MQLFYSFLAMVGFLSVGGSCMCECSDLYVSSKDGSSSEYCELNVQPVLPCGFPEVPKCQCPEGHGAAGSAFERRCRRGDDDEQPCTNADDLVEYAVRFVERFGESRSNWTADSCECSSKAMKPMRGPQESVVCVHPFVTYQTIPCGSSNPPICNCTGAFAEMEDSSMGCLDVVSGEVTRCGNQAALELYERQVKKAERR
ncbi:PREDICTED: uncharacterized protein LOC108557908 [Nicrophorus vespilloides]|uniref:Uncharacterized protein LOC108557908 n=1 Tax=Nicrophorus vespilloides TaxID=110193 RepID=A0ABM1M6B0_NICVS|nr:PREDICTED: uncharacterized protein LOC108557908 [Nicrophorus vespilloides]